MSDVLGGKRFRVEKADCLEFMRRLPDGCVDLVFCSPPYEQARLYLENGADMGIARDTEAWVAWMVEVATECRRVCKGLCAFVVEGQTRNYRYSCGPFLLMADQHRKGFCLRKPSVFKRIGVCGGGGNRGQHEDEGGGADWLRNDWEPVVCFTATQGKLPWADGTAMGHPPKWAPGGEMSNRVKDGHRRNQWGGHENKRTSQRKKDGSFQGAYRPSHVIGGSHTKRRKNGVLYHDGNGYIPPAMANPGNVIDCGAAGGGHMGNSMAHDNEAPFPEVLPEFFIRSFAREGDIVYDPFCGSGTTPAVAVRWNRRALATDLRQSQVDLTLRRLDTETPLALFAQD